MGQSQCPDDQSHAPHQNQQGGDADGNFGFFDTFLCSMAEEEGGGPGNPYQHGKIVHKAVDFFTHWETL